MHFQRAEPPLKMMDSADAEAFFRACFDECDPTVENLLIAHLDDQARCLQLTRHEGDACSAAFPIREVVLTAAALGSSGLVLAHNHPSGDPRPSSSDCRITTRIATVARAIGCSVIDHLVFGGGRCTSLRKMGLL